VVVVVVLVDLVVVVLVVVLVVGSGTALLARALGLAPSLRLATVSRQLTSPLAMACADLLGAPRGTAVALVVVTGLLGANAGQKLMDAIGCRSPAARGLTMGASGEAHHPPPPCIPRR
jgi:putative effector of murein hydrolase